MHRGMLRLRDKRRRDEDDIACIKHTSPFYTKPNVEPKGQPVRHNELIIWAQTKPNGRAKAAVAANETMS